MDYANVHDAVPHYRLAHSLEDGDWECAQLGREFMRLPIVCRTGVSKWGLGGRAVLNTEIKRGGRHDLKALQNTKYWCIAAESRSLDW